MANWKYKLNFIDLKKQYDAKEIALSEFSASIVIRINHSFPGTLDYDDDLIAARDGMELAGDDVEAFDEAMKMLYDWGDKEVAPVGKFPKNKMCWIAMA